MGTVFRRRERRPVPLNAELVVKEGRQFARWKKRGKMITAAVEVADDGNETVVVMSGVYIAKFRDHTGRIVERSTGCREESTARQKLTAWEREAERIRAGVLDASDLETARAAASPLADLIIAFKQSLIARDVSMKYQENLIRDLQKLMFDVPIKSLRDLRLSKVEQWFARSVTEGMKGRTRNRYREAMVAFARWCVLNNKLREHDLDKLPKADPKADLVRVRRSLTEDEFLRLLAVARTRPVDDARTVRRGKNKGKKVAELSPTSVAELEQLGRERVLIYRTLILTGLRLNELRTLAIGNIDLIPGEEVIRLDRKNEKSGAGSTLPIRTDLANELRLWISEKQLSPADRLFTVPVELRAILYLDLQAAGIPRKDDRGRVLDVHALRVSFATHLSASGAAPRTAQAALRHSDIKLTMQTYTDPALLAVRDALNRLPSFTLAACSKQTDSHPSKPPTKAPPTIGNPGQLMAPVGNLEDTNSSGEMKRDRSEIPGNGDENALVTSTVITRASVNESSYSAP